MYALTASARALAAISRKLIRSSFEKLGGSVRGLAGAATAHARRKAD